MSNSVRNIALVGLPNVGKSSLFNNLTGNRQRVANFPGVTVEKRLGEYEGGGKKLNLIDLPGIYNMEVLGLEEKLTRDVILEKSDSDRVDLYVLVIDATSLKKSLYLALQLQELNLPFVIALNMSDLMAERGVTIDLKAFSKAFDTEVILVSSKDMSSSEQLARKLLDYEIPANKKIQKIEGYNKKILQADYVDNKFKKVEDLGHRLVDQSKENLSISEKIDSYVLHPVLGPVILVVTMLTLFQVLFYGADPFIGLIEDGFEVLATFIREILPAGPFSDLLTDGVIAGVGGVLVFLPHIIFLFLIINTLEDLGYLGRVAFLLDHFMRKVGLPGKAVVPMLSSHACAIPGIMSARILSQHRERLITMMVAPLTTCSARLPVYSLIIAAMFPTNLTFLGLGVAGLVMFGLYFMGIASAFVISFILHKRMPSQLSSTLLMELPDYKVPSFSRILKSSLGKGWLFVKKAGGVILVLSIALWFLLSFPKNDQGVVSVEESYAAQIGKAITPVFAPLGFDWKLTTSLIPSLAAREVLVSSLSTVLAVQADNDEEYRGFSKLLGAKYSLATLLALLVWFVYSPQCISTFAVLRKETGGYKYPLIFGAYSLALAFIMSAFTYQLFSFLT